MTYYKRTINIDGTVLAISDNRKAVQQNWQMKEIGFISCTEEVRSAVV